MAKRITSNEFFYLEKDGRKNDGDLHDDMLDNPAADLFCRIQSARNGVDKGWTPLEVALKRFEITMAQYLGTE